jgi:hypothetical protein
MERVRKETRNNDRDNRRGIGTTGSKGKQRERQISEE